MAERTSIRFSDDARTRAIASLRAYADEHLDEAMGDLKAGLLLDHILTDIGPLIYNQAVSDARAYREERTADLEAALAKSEFPVSSRRRR